MIPTILIAGHNHFDPTWRRCFDRPATYNGVTVRSYADIEELVMKAWLALAGRGYTQNEGQAVIWRMHLGRNPGDLPRLQAEVKAGRLAVMMAGETVQDSNLPIAEGLVRNFLVAMPLYRQLCGEDHPALAAAWLEDAFGNSANYPQVLRGVGCRAAWRITYRSVLEEVWVGIDGTAIACLDHLPNHSVSPFDKHPPCPACQGAGCPACDRTGMALSPMLNRELVLAQAVAGIDRLLSGAGADKDRLDLQGGGSGPADGAFLTISGEEPIPSAAVCDVVAELQQRYAGKARLVWGSYADVLARHLPRLEALVAARQGGTPTPDLNPAMPGCMVTRIALKQRPRQIGHLLTAAESILANAAWKAGRPVAQPAELSEAWRLTAFCQFHDAITGTLIDSAARELHDFLDRAEAIARVTVPAAVPAAEPAWRPVPGNAGSLRLGRFELAFDRKGLTSVLVDGRDLHGEQRFSPHGDRLRIGELVLESDFGDAWGTRIASLGSPWMPSNARPLGEFNVLVETADGAVRWSGSYRGGHRKVRRLEWTQTVRLSACGRFLAWTTDIDWDAESKRIRAVFPVADPGDRALYEIPFGFLERRFDVSQIDYTQWRGNLQEYPTQHWAMKPMAGGGACALLTRGLPCVRWMPGRFDLSLLRSPEAEFCQVEQVHYEFWDTDGMRDAGRHRLEYAWWPEPKGLTPAALTEAGYAYNREGWQAPPFAIAGAVIATAWKPAEDGDGWILRLQETAGAPTTVELRFAEERTVTPTDLLERPARPGAIGQPGRGRSWSAPLHRHGIMTLRIR
jgi:alpha-mannosidase